MRFVPVLALLVALCGACGSAPQQYTPPEGGFTVTFPANHGSKGKIAETEPKSGVKSYSNMLTDDQGQPTSCPDCPVYVVLVSDDPNPDTPLHEFNECTIAAHVLGEAVTTKLGTETAVRARCIDKVGVNYVIVARHGGKRYAVLTWKADSASAEEFFTSFSFTS